MLDGFRTLQVERDAVPLRVRVAGEGTPLLLLHGHPQTHAMWHRVAPQLAERFTVVAMDLRGYGDSGRPQAGEGSAAYAKREMALDALHVMRTLGHDRFQVLAHDRGARVAHRLALDHAAAVERLLLLDIAPTLAMYRGTGEAFARAYWHWFFLIQPPPLPEALIAADGARP
jgi:haloacetate dehalogenase